ncbi:hypothetical protein M5D96_004595 [Drosophila gunungcola]|uniref:Uncharacterized protein n=1 Tax=Drosophila gunungcola TaxID=103775 RepID=A0A9P9YUZ2_9MUSC|nr:hypothetical protein M5D96_004595 [Drosophila gunungcola]
MKLRNEIFIFLILVIYGASKASSDKELVKEPRSHVAKPRSFLFHCLRGALRCLLPCLWPFCKTCPPCSNTPTRPPKTILTKNPITIKCLSYSYHVSLRYQFLSTYIQIKQTKN